MTYIIVTAKQTVIGQPFASFASAYGEASRIFGDDPAAFDASIIVAAFGLVVLVLRPAFRD